MPTRQPVPVLGIIWTELELDAREYEHQLGLTTSKMDDAYWARFVRQPFTWQRFTIWWVARRWIRPRDIRRD